MYGTVIVPLDGSVFGEHAIPTAVRMARATGARLVLVRVHHADRSHPYHEAEWDELFRSEEDAYLERRSARIQADFADVVETVVLDGAVVEAICALSHDRPSPLIVMSTHGRTGLSRAWLGSVADGIVRHSTCPVLMVRSSEVGAAPRAPPVPFSDIVIPLDGSPFAEQVIPHAMAVAEATCSRVLLFRVVQQPAAPELTAGIPFAAIGDANAAALESSIQDATDYLCAVFRRLQDKYPKVGRRTEAHAASSPAVAIIERSVVLDHALVALATHGRGMSRLVVGSVADKVIRGTRGPVLVFRATAVEQRAVR